MGSSDTHHEAEEIAVREGKSKTIEGRVTLIKVERKRTLQYHSIKTDRN